jgi:putative MATE family efflux protein
MPVLLGNLFQQFYSIADIVIVGKFLGVQALASVGSTGALSFLVIGFVIGVSSGFGIPVANFFGSGDMPAVRKCIFNILIASAALTAVITVLTASFTGALLEAMNTPEDIYEGAYTYIRIIFLYLGGIMLYNVLASIARAVGDSKTPLYFLIMSSVLNIGMDLLFIAAFKMGIAGAALATAFSQLISGILCLIYMYVNFKELRPRKENCALDMRLVRHLLYMGLPMALQFSITAIGSVILQSAVNSFGSLAVAAITAGSKVQMMLAQPMEALGASIAMYVSQNIGAKRLDRVRSGIKSSLFMAVSFSMVSCFIANAWGRTISLLFISPDQVEILLGVKQYLFAVSIFFWALGVLLLLRNAIQGLGYALPAMMAGVFELAARTLMAFISVRWFGFQAVVFSNSAAWIFACLILIPLYLKIMGKMKKRRIWVSEGQSNEQFSSFESGVDPAEEQIEGRREIGYGEEQGEAIPTSEA